MTTTRTTYLEAAVWCALAVIGGLIAGWVDVGTTNAQSSVLVLMVTAFALTLPGRAPAAGIAVCSSIGIPVLHALRLHDASAGLVLVLIPSAIGAYGGRAAGGLLDTAVKGLSNAPQDDDHGVLHRPMSTRFLLAVALVAAAVAGVPSVHAVLHTEGYRAPMWVAQVWQIMTLLGWIGIARPLLLRQRARSGRTGAQPGVTPVDVAHHAAVIVTLAAVHVTILMTLSTVLFIPPPASWMSAWSAALLVYLPFDLMVYLAILALGVASDVERHRAESAQREQAMRASLVDGRLAALRARLNPHFLFNALNSVHALACAHDAEATARVVEKLTTLLRYVLDERRATVPLSAELDFVEGYLELQQVRFGARLQYEIHRDASAMAIEVPQLILQPIVENAVEHGVGATLEGGRVRVTASCVGDSLSLIVDDDGAGPPAGEPTAGIGLASTRERLAVQYNGRARLTMSRADAQRGTRVAIEIPPRTPPKIIAAS